mmetsp:Transcript_25018/g.54849  ORF Transcript_25018/g.54849 Transcript_25018/m.54849 type:complete len:810 (+) Transcript_25018:51-2480(+)
MVATLIFHSRYCSIISCISYHRRELVASVAVGLQNNETGTVGRITHHQQQQYWNRGRMVSSASSSSSATYYDSHGDYQADDESDYFMPYNRNISNADTITATPPPLFQHQGSLPRFPVPKLTDTLERLKPSCLPLATKNHGQEEQANFLRACELFPEQAKDLQRGLEDRAASNRHQENWLQSWWNQIGYLQFREPSPINVNYMFQLPKTRATKEQRQNRSFSQLERGARVLHSAFAYSELVQIGSLPQEMIGKQRTTPLCSSMYKYLFYSCRIPKPNQDIYRIYRFHSKTNDNDNETNVVPKHAVVSARGHYFSVDLIDPSTGSPYSIEELELALEDCLRQAVSLSSQTDTTVNTINNNHNEDGVTAAEAVKNLGLLTAANRDEWTSNRVTLLDNIPGMKTALERLESGLLLLCLDGNDDANTNDNHNDRNAHVDSLSQNARSYLMGTQGRWYDKSMQFILTPTADLGVNGEHSMMDGMPVVGLCQYILKQEARTKNMETNLITEESPTRSPPKVEPIFANKTILNRLMNKDKDGNRHGLAITRSMIQKATTDFNKLRTSLDLEVQSFHGYGARWIKTQAKCSPDAYVQMAIQLAVGKLTTKSTNSNISGNSDDDDQSSSHYVPWATYESTQVRSYRYGRTETTRSVSPQSAKWVESMLHNKSNNKELKDLFHQATDAHVNFIQKASQGCGVDRHLFGLQMILAEQNQEQQEQEQQQQVTLFQDPLFLRSKEWKVSTSTLPVNPGFGPVVIPDGVGTAYDIQPNHIYFTCTSYKGLAPALSHYLEESLVEMKEMIMIPEAEERNGRSKL